MSVGKTMIKKAFRQSLLLAGLIALPAYSETSLCIVKTPYTNIKTECEVKYKSADRLQIFNLYPDNQVLTIDLRLDNTYSLKNEYWADDAPTGNIVSNIEGSYFRDGGHMVLTSEFGVIEISPSRN